MKFSTKDKNLIEHYRASAPFTAIDLLLVALIVFAVTVSITYAFPDEDATYAYIYVAGEEYGKYSLDKDCEILLSGGHVKVEIENGSIAVTESDCPTGICMQTGFVNKVGARIVCAPNKIVIALRAGNDKEYITGRSQ